ncbi:MAG: hypothetical protein GY772_22795 [bacterium]|nr:hypothetical protein [bacterium]
MIKKVKGLQNGAPTGVRVIRTHDFHCPKKTEFEARDLLEFGQEATVPQTRADFRWARPFPHPQCELNVFVPGFDHAFDHRYEAQ